MNEDTIKFLAARIIEKAKETASESANKNEDEFFVGKKLAYYEVLDILQSELYVRDVDLEKFGLNLDLLNDSSL
ncbi:hypothetical protein LFYK43_15200 [Ligilactobacillus salitolerans]|uniref:Transposase n=1 Tax=Ligilactobacillus salitolerans TaxID=1808352 RepID=A0A401IU49_9LACO|nr:transposase [Ligilactobacillus salitolerans]GBG95061.1 hypothetical protein LFYK43_15200 [Ligilactobacillus salitolerans]